MTETKRCCDLCLRMMQDFAGSTKLGGVYATCADVNCPCHLPVSKDCENCYMFHVPINKAGCKCECHTPPPTGRTDEQNKAILDHARPLIEENRRLLGLDTTNTPTDGYSREELKKHCWLDENHEEQMPLDEVEAILTQALAEQKARMVEEIEAKSFVIKYNDIIDLDVSPCIKTDDAIAIIKALSK